MFRNVHLKGHQFSGRAPFGPDEIRDGFLGEYISMPTDSITLKEAVQDDPVPEFGL